MGGRAELDHAAIAEAARLWGNETVIGIQVRVGQDSVNKKQDAVYPGADKAHAAFECAAALRDSKGAQSKLFLMTDDKYIIDQAHRLFGTAVTYLNKTFPVTSSADKLVTLNDMREALIEWFLFSSVDDAVVTYGSSFALTAFCMRLKM